MTDCTFNIIRQSGQRFHGSCGVASASAAKAEHIAWLEATSAIAHGNITPPPTTAGAAALELTAGTTQRTLCCLPRFNTSVKLSLWLWPVAPVPLSVLRRQRCLAPVSLVSCQGEPAVVPGLRCAPAQCAADSQPATSCKHCPLHSCVRHESTIANPALLMRANQLNLDLHPCGGRPSPHHNIAAHLCTPEHTCG